MSLESELNDRLKLAMKAKATRELDVLRMIKARILERTKSVGFQPPLTDAHVLEILEAYVKQMKKAVEEYQALGPAGAAHVDKLAFEVAYLEPLLPAKLDAEATRKLVVEEIAAQGVSEKKLVGKIVGALAKRHGKAIDAALVKQVAESLLS